MAVLKERISNEGDFPGLIVYREALPAGPVYSVEFKNREHILAGIKGRTQQGLYALCWTILFVGSMGLGFYLALYVPGSGTSGPVWMVITLVLGFWSARPYTVRRAVEIDFARNELRVRKRGRVKLRKPLPGSSLTLAVEPHWGAFDSDAGTAAIGRKMHCLVGYFGLMGTDRAVLLCRHERTPTGGLREVMAAVMMAWEAGQRERMGF